VDHHNLHRTTEVLVPHANAPLTETGRLRLARCIVEDGWPPPQAAERFQVAPTTARRWADRYRTEGEAGMADHSSRPHHSPHRTPTRTERRIINLRVQRRWGPARIAGLLGMHASTVHRILTRYHLARLTGLDRATSQVIRRYERARPGELVHVDIKKLGNIPDGGGHKVHGRSIGTRHRSAHRDPAQPPIVHGRPNLGYSYLHNAIDDHSRLAYTEILPDETRQTAAAFWTRAQAFFARAGITVERVMTDNGACYKSFLWRDTLAAAGITHKRTRPYRPQTNGKVERFNRILLDEWAYAKPYQSESERRAALPGFLHHYNHHRHHTAIGGPPVIRIPNLSGQYS
jgi:transposase InsO family protein